MAFTKISDVTIDLSNRAPAEFSSVEVDAKNGYLFYLALLAPAIPLTNTYFTVVAIFDTDEGVIETNLEGKFFPKGRFYMFSVAVPEGEYFKKVQCSIEVEAKRRSRALPDTGLAVLTLYWDDKIELKAEQAPI